MDQDLASAAYGVADAYRSGAWPGLAGKAWPAVWGYLIEELKSRCPGRTPREYGNALEEGFLASR